MGFQKLVLNFREMILFIKLKENSNKQAENAYFHVFFLQKVNTGEGNEMNFMYTVPVRLQDELHVHLSLIHI